MKTAQQQRSSHEARNARAAQERTREDERTEQQGQEVKR